MVHAYPAFGTHLLVKYGMVQLLDGKLGVWPSTCTSNGYSCSDSIILHQE
jgi:hypothetical protein